jgi:hypothetical protein
MGRFGFRSIAVTLLAASTLASCAQRPLPTPPNWDNRTPSQPSTRAPEAIITAPPTHDTEEPVMAPVTNWAGQRTLTQGCTGSYTLSEAGTGKVISSGRAYNTGDGFAVLDKNARRTSRIVNASLNQSLIFLPDCGCTSASSGSSEENLTAVPDGHLVGGSCRPE